MDAFLELDIVIQRLRSAVSDINFVRQKWGVKEYTASEDIKEIIEYLDGCMVKLKALEAKAETDEKVKSLEVK